MLPLASFFVECRGSAIVRRDYFARVRKSPQPASSNCLVPCSFFKTMSQGPVSPHAGLSSRPKRFARPIAVRWGRWLAPAIGTTSCMANPRNFAIPKALSVASLMIVARAQANFSHCCNLSPSFSVPAPAAISMRLYSCDSSWVARSRPASVALNRGATPKNRAAGNARGAPMLRRGERASVQDLVRLAQADRKIAGHAESQRHVDERQREARGGGNGGQARARPPRYRGTDDLDHGAQ
jgi:hypothetical protein